MASRKICKGLVLATVYYFVVCQIVVHGYPQRNYYQSRQSAYPSDSYYNSVQSNTYSNRRSDESNSKFAGATNQEEERTFHRKKLRRFFNQRPHHSNDPCRGRSANEQEGRFFWDLNIFNVYANSPHSNDQFQSQRPSYDCGGGGGGGGGTYNDNYRPPNRPLFSIPVYRPPNNNRPSNNRPSNNNNNNNNNDDIYDPVNDDRPVTENIPNDNPAPQQLFLTPGQAVGGIASTVNNVIQTLTGSNRPGRGQGSQSDSVNVDVQNLGPGQIVGGLANTVTSVIQTLAGNGRNGAFLNALYSGFNLF